MSDSYAGLPPVRPTPSYPPSPNKRHKVTVQGEQIFDNQILAKIANIANIGNSKLQDYPQPANPISPLPTRDARSQQCKEKKYLTIKYRQRLQILAKVNIRITPSQPAQPNPPSPDKNHKVTEQGQNKHLTSTQSE